ncbi:cytochrome P450 [Myxococcota bacterium]|nr:cytochrome P450 [Myxococcota bacterium]
MVDYDPFSPVAMQDPYPTYRELREHAPVYRLESYDAWALSRFEDVWQVISDAESFTIVEGPSFVKQQISEPFVEGITSPADSNRSFATWDPPHHTHIRAVMSPYFRPGAVRKLESFARELAGRTLDNLLPEGRMDVVSDYASPVSVRVICRVMGVTDEEAPHLIELVNRSARRETGKPGMTADGRRAQAEMHARVAEQVVARRAGAEGPPGVIDNLLGAEIDGEPLNDIQIATQLASLLMGGTETMPKIVAGGLVELERNSDQRLRLAANLDQSGFAFEEMMRHQGVLQWVGRTALREVQVGDARIRPGQRVFLLLQSANRDEREFDDAESFDIGRRPERNLSLGHGPHHCIGSQVARMEGRVLLEELMRRVPTYTVDMGKVQRPPSDFQIGYTVLPMEWNSKT